MKYEQPACLPQLVLVIYSKYHIYVNENIIPLFFVNMERNNLQLGILIITLSAKISQIGNTCHFLFDVFPFILKSVRVS